MEQETMIHITDKSQCCGCGACVQSCPRHCITMKADKQGFLYAKTDETLCIDCKRCESVCPILNHSTERIPIKTLAAKIPNKELRLLSSSGGVFTALASYVINCNGVVFGARFDNEWNVVHGYAETIDELAQFRGSKYVQSNIGDSYRQVKAFLKQERFVLFSGTPCQVAGLRKFLRKEYDHLLLVDVVCHGVPSPQAWKTYIANKDVFHVNFRDKKLGWKKYSMNINHVSCFYQRDRFMLCFLANLTLRPSCFNCQFKSGTSGSDLTLGDFWGITEIEPHFDDDIGASVVLSYTAKGNSILEQIELNRKDVEYEKVCLHNSSIHSSAKQPNNYEEFWKDFSLKGKGAIEKWGKKQSPSLIVQIKQLVKKIFRL